MLNMTNALNHFNFSDYNFANIRLRKLLVVFLMVHLSISINQQFLCIHQ